jgi:DNA-directed RNA polymerase beta subunit
MTSESKATLDVPTVRLIGDPCLKQNDLILVTDSEIEEKGLVNHHIESMNDLYQNGIHQIITRIFKVEKDIENKRTNTPEDLEIEKINVVVNFTDVFMSRPTMINYFSGKEEVLYPNVALLGDKTYSANLRVNATIKATAYLRNGTTKVKEDEITNFKICRIPIMVRSVMCNTHGCSKESLINLKEDPEDPGGYFIIKGVEWVIDCIENILFNQIRIFKNHYNKEVMRAEFISKPGDSYQNMGYLVIRWLNDGQITCEIVRDKMRGIYVPFYLFFRVLGWTTDKQIFDNITYGAPENDSISKNMINYLRTAFNAKYPIMMAGRNTYKQNEVLRVIADELKRDSLKYLELDTNEEAYTQAYRIIHREFDVNMLPHVGQTPDTRHRKLRFLALIIRRMFLVKMGNLQPTDRDSYMSKRIHSAGVSYAKPLKTYFNASIVQQIKRRLVKDFKAMSFSQINLAASVKSSVYGADFERLITQAITSGNRAQLTINVRRKVTNRLSSQLLNRHNQLSVYSTLRQVTTTSSDNSKQSERASEMRRVHMTFIGYICVAHSPEGEKTGINKQMCISATVCKASSSEVVKDMLRNDPDIIPDNEVFPEMISAQGLSIVYVNGDWIGCTKDTLKIVNKYRQMRRRLEINPYLTIHWENTQDEVYFWADVGRMMRPLLIVYNNQRDPDEFSSSDQKKPFRQGSALTEDHIKKLYQKKIGINDLLKQRIIEYVSPEEQENYWLCPTLEQLQQDSSNELNEYTHCDISQNILGLTALTSPYAHHNAVPRLAYQTSQAKQTCGLFALNWPYRCDKDTFLQYQCETPMIRTLSNKYTFPNGSNIICAIMCNSGYNQEDSLIFSQGAIDRGLFNGCKFTFYRTELEQKEEFGNPDAATTTDIKSASYEKLENGIIKIGSRVEKGDAIIGKYVRLSKSENDSKFLYSDRSIIYKDDEPAIVYNVIVDRNEDDERFCKVALRKLRPVVTGDKFSSRSGQKGIAALSMRDSDMPFIGKTGERISVIFNPHGLPSRRTIGMFYEMLVAKTCAKRGSHSDGTIFKKFDQELVADDLESMGVQRYGYERLINGMTGEYIDALIFAGPIYYQRLQKFVVDQVYSIAQGPSDAITYQPLDGKASSGGLRVGEMEQWCLTAHGASRFMSEKFRDHSDGYDYYVCRCGRPAIVNVAKNIYKCKYCKDNAEIAKIPTTWSSKLFMQEMDAMNVGVKMHIEPHEYENFNVKDFDDVVQNQIKIEGSQAEKAMKAEKLR